MNYIEKIAIDLRSRLGISEDERPDLLDVLRRLRIIGLISDFGPDRNGDLAGLEARWDRDKRYIVVAGPLWDRLLANDDAVRFTLYHEIGHAVLNHEARNRKVDGRPQFGRVVEKDELEADDLALAFAIPLSFLGAMDTRDAQSLSERFGLTDFMTQRRMVALQRHERVLKSPHEQDSEDSYAEAMSLMRANALAWNANIRAVPTKDEDWDF